MSQVNDFRVGFNLKYKLVDILTIAVLAVLSGVETWDDMELYGKERHSLLKKFLELPAGTPSHDTFNRVFSLLNPKSLETALQEWISSLVSSLPPDIIAIDGKSLRGSNKPSAHSFVHMASAFACSCGLSLAQIKVDEKSNKITAIPKLLDMIDIEGCTISIDAMGCQKDIAAKIISKKADYILAVKDNHPTLRLDALLMSKHCRPDDDFIDTDAGHGRVEQRRTRIYRDMAYVSQFWTGVSAVIRVDSLRYDKSNNEYKALETRFYITRLHHVEASQFARWIRAHWGIENQLHWVLDIAFNEDASQKRAGYSAENFSRLLRFARNILKRYKDTHPTKLSYRSMKFKAALQEDFDLEVLKSVFVWPALHDTTPMRLPCNRPEKNMYSLDIASDMNHANIFEEYLYPNELVFID